MCPRIFHHAGCLLWGLAWLAVGAAVLTGRLAVIDKPATPQTSTGAKLIGGALIVWGIVSIAFSVSGMTLSSSASASASGDGSDSGVDCAAIAVYTMKGCGWCEKAKDALTKKNIAFVEHEYVRDSGKEPEKMPNGKRPDSFPQIWSGSTPLGGFGELDKWTSSC